MTTTNKGTFQPDSDVHITYEDQQKINKFARLNAKLDDIKEEIKNRENELRSVEDACDEIALLDDDGMIPYLVGEVFIYQNLENTQESLDNAKKDIEKEIKNLNEESVKIKDLMIDLKGHLYGKFGSHINLEADEE